MAQTCGLTLDAAVAERPVVLTTSRAPRRIPRHHIANLAAAIVVATLVLYASFFGAGPLAVGHAAATPIILTLLAGTLLGLTGAWLGSAGRTIVQPAISRKSASVSADGDTPSSR